MASTPSANIYGIPSVPDWIDDSASSARTTQGFNPPIVPEGSENYMLDTYSKTADERAREENYKLFAKVMGLTDSVFREADSAISKMLGLVSQVAAH
jgi:hypothetical protein